MVADVGGGGVDKDTMKGLRTRKKGRDREWTGSDFTIMIWKGKGGGLSSEDFKVGRGHRHCAIPVQAPIRSPFYRGSGSGVALEGLPALPYLVSKLHCRVPSKAVRQFQLNMNSQQYL
jgi:hypothetical protein